MKNQNAQHLILFDTQPSSLQVLENMFQKTNYRFHSARTKEELLQLHQNHPIDLVLAHISPNYIEEIELLHQLAIKKYFSLIIGIIPKTIEIDEKLTSSIFETVIETDLEEKKILSLVDQYLKYNPMSWTSSIDDAHQSYWYKKLLTAYSY